MLDVFVFVSYRYFIIKTLIVKPFILAFVPAGKIFPQESFKGTAKNSSGSVLLCRRKVKLRWVMIQAIKASGKQRLRFSFFATLGEGLLVGLLGGLIKNYLADPLVLLAGSFYICWRIGHVYRWVFLPAVPAGLLLYLFLGKEELSASSYMVIDCVLVSLVMVLSYYLFSGAHFFATYSRSGSAWVATIVSATVTAALVGFALPYPAVVMLTPVLWLCLLPLWCANKRVVHSLLFALIYLATLYLMYGTVHSLSGRESLYLMLRDWTVWFAAMLMALIPELLALFYPERKHNLDSFPVITPTLNFRQKIRATREVFFLAVDFYAMVMEKYWWFIKIARTGKFLVGAGVLLEIVPAGSGYISLPVGFSLFLFAAGILLELGMADYNVVAWCFALYGLSLLAGRVLLAGSGHPGIIAWALILVLLAVFIWCYKPGETKAELEKWKNLNKP